MKRLGIVFLMSLIIVACAPSPTPELGQPTTFPPTQTTRPTSTPVETAMPEHTATPVATLTPEATPTLVPSPTPTLEATPTLVPSPTPTTVPQLWKTTGPPITPLVSLAVAPSDPNTIYAVSGRLWWMKYPGAGHLFKSTNGGRSWSVVYPRWPAFPESLLLTGALAVHPQDRNTLYAGIMSVVFSPNYDQFYGIGKSTDGGVTWQVVYQDENPARVYSDPYTEGSPEITSIAISQQPSHTVYVGRAWPWLNTPVGRSQDGGETWEWFEQQSIYSLVVDPRDANIVYAGTSDGFYKSTDGAQSWNKTIPAATTSIALDLRKSGVVYAGTLQPGRQPILQMSRDGGGTWQTVASLSGPQMMKLVVDSESSDLMFAITGAKGDRRFGDYRRIYRSTDAGVTWEEILHGVDDIAIAAGGRLLATTGGISLSDDLGASWTTTITPVSGERGGNQLANTLRTPEIVYAKCDYSYYGTLDGGESWSTISRPPEGLEFLVTDPLDGHIVYGRTFSRMLLYKSNDAGTTWAELASIPSACRPHVPDLPLFVHPRMTEKIFAAGVSAICAIDSSTGIVLSESPVPSSVQALAADVQSTTVYAGTYSNGIYKSTDGGNTWSPTGYSEGYVGDIGVSPHDPNLIFAATGGGLI